MLNPPYFIKDYKANISFLVKGDFSLQEIENRETYEITDIYTPNKHSIILKDLIQVIILI